MSSSRSPTTRRTVRCSSTARRRFASARSGRSGVRSVTACHRRCSARGRPKVGLTNAPHLEEFVRALHRVAPAEVIAPRQHGQHRHVMSGRAPVFAAPPRRHRLNPVLVADQRGLIGCRASIAGLRRAGNARRRTLCGRPRRSEVPDACGSRKSLAPRSRTIRSASSCCPPPAQRERTMRCSFSPAGPDRLPDFAARQRRSRRSSFVSAATSSLPISVAPADRTLTVASTGRPTATELFHGVSSDRQSARLPLALEGTAELAQYTTAASVEDIEAIRVALRYSQLTLVGGSYGTRLAMDTCADTSRASAPSFSKGR